MTKICSKCKIEKDVSDFNRQSQNTSGIRSYCRKCQKAMTKDYQSRPEVIEKRKQYQMDHKEQRKEILAKYYRENKDRCNALSSNLGKQRQKEHSLRVIEYLGGSCYICGLVDECYEIFDAHHVNPDEKEYGIARLTHKDWGTIIQPELDKCILVCSNCHRKLTKGRFTDDIASCKLVLIPGKRENMKIELRIVNG
jgi:hypothetical protein